MSALLSTIGEGHGLDGVRAMESQRRERYRLALLAIHISFGDWPSEPAIGDRTTLSLPMRTPTPNRAMGPRAEIDNNVEPRRESLPVAISHQRLHVVPDPDREPIKRYPWDRTAINEDWNKD